MTDFEKEIKMNTQHPQHYGGDGVYEVIKVLKEWGIDKNAYLWNCMKYIARAGKKNGNPLLQDLMKAQFYLNYYIEILRNIDKNENNKSQENDEKPEHDVRIRSISYKNM